MLATLCSAWNSILSRLTKPTKSFLLSFLDASWPLYCHLQRRESFPLPPPATPPRRSVPSLRFCLNCWRVFFSLPSSCSSPSFPKPLLPASVSLHQLSRFFAFSLLSLPRAERSLELSVRLLSVHPSLLLPVRFSPSFLQSCRSARKEKRRGGVSRLSGVCCVTIFEQTREDEGFSVSRSGKSSLLPFRPIRRSENVCASPIVFPRPSCSFSSSPPPLLSFFFLSVEPMTEPASPSSLPSLLCLSPSSSSLFLLLLCERTFRAQTQS